MKHLGDYSAGRDNNFNLLRFIAASAVLVSHSFLLVTGDPRAEPLRQSLGLSLGELAVGVFFATSGFLVTGSLLNKRSVTEFFLSRALRIYPGLSVAVILTVVICGLFYTESSASVFFIDRETWRYLVTNTVMLGFETYRLPGTFEHLPFSGIVNGSLWSLPFEIRLYILLGFAWIAFSAMSRTPARWLKVFCVAVAVSAVALDLAFLWIHVWNPDVFREPRIVGLSATFFSGATLRALQHRVPMSRLIFGILIVALGLSALTSSFLFVYKLAFPYVVLYIALVPRGRMRRFNQLGDYSYGIYIYAYPVQQAIVHAAPGVTAWHLIVVSFPLTLALAFASWHLIEKRALRLRRQAAPAVVPDTHPLESAACSSNMSRESPPPCDDDLLKLGAPTAS